MPLNMARVETQVYRKAWRKLLETHGSHDGLLRCAITTPDDFALTRSFFQNTDARQLRVAVSPLGTIFFQRYFTGFA